MPNTKGFQVRLTTEQKQEIRSLYLIGKDHNKIIEEFGCSRGTFWSIVEGLCDTVAEERAQHAIKVLNDLKQVQLGWIAGIVDGEGYIGLVPNTKHGITPRVDVSSTTKCMQDQLHSLVGGYIGEKKRKNCPTYKKLWNWALWAVESVGPFLKVIGPLLVVKHRQAEVVLKFCERRTKARGMPYTKEDWNDVKRMHVLNKRGKL